MTSVTEKHKQEMMTLEVEIEDEEETEGLEEDAPADPSITRQICLKTMHPSEKKDRDVILRRIRHHKRMIKVKGAVKTLFISPLSTTPATNMKDSFKPSREWVNEAFSMP